LQVLFFEDPKPVNDLEQAFPLYAHHFPVWSEHTSAMHQFALWTALEAAGFGANLQHYNPIIDRKAQEHWNVPLEWKLRAQLVFGGRAGEPGPKDFKPLEQRLFVHGAKE
jgi:predicted oxidoreductase (fatty acid repression mutant protein)